MQIPNNLTLTIQKKKLKCFESLIDNNYFDMKTYESLRCYSGKWFKIYGILKIHKENFPLRLVVSILGSAMLKIASFINRLLKTSGNNFKWNVKDSSRLVKN